ncbi:unnamed protein product, partial [Ascophyllum nodosum]
MTSIGFDQAKVDPCVFRKVVDGEAEMVVVVHVDDILAHGKDQAAMDRFTAKLGQKFPYREAAGALMGTATMTRPDVACAVRAVARFCENPGPAHKKAGMKILQYLLHTKEWGITYGEQGCGLCIEAYTDSDFGACLDTRRSVSGAVLMLATGAISWHSRMQEVTASGTSEAEY